MLGAATTFLLGLLMLVTGAVLAFVFIVDLQFPLLQSMLALLLLLGGSQLLDVAVSRRPRRKANLRSLQTTA